MTVERAVQLLRRMGFDVSKAYPVGWYVVGNNPDPQWVNSGGELIDYALAELAEREDVMERVEAKLLNPQTDTFYIRTAHGFCVQQPWGCQIDSISNVDAVKQSIELGMTDDQLLGVE